MGFKLEREPIDMQLTVHIMNMINTWSRDCLTDSFNMAIYCNHETEYFGTPEFRAMQIVDYYGPELCIQFLLTFHNIDLRSQAA